ncbi:prepilin-type N-terminal cleavage/methylation domain-containing protein [Hippea sp. KM1]|uniref:prepilin-type N-terminal cleavage/methylation domain-containing protein n=1 Tax=Hippea sp. KM1 TaxID=944481 RepID=UPI00046CBA96|nr:prepilin-type N-terminal cleavage/methylation domain-containing protein [Hippea sp. KM1]
MRKEGFTLIELIIVIVIIGILAAFAIPKFANLTGESKKAVIEGVAGSIRSAANIVHAKWLAQGGGDTVTMADGDNVTVGSNGYPTADSSGISKAINLDGADKIVDQDNGTFAYDNKTDCSVTYDNSTTPPTVKVTTTGCE